MKNTIERISGLRTRLGLLTIAFLLGTTAALAQSSAAPAADTLSGKYEGTLKAPDEQVSLEFKSADGRMSGRFVRGSDALDLSDGTFEDGTLILNFSKKALLTAQVQGDKLVGDWLVGTHRRSLELKKVTPAPAAASAAAPASADFNLNGQWEAVADANGQPLPFLLTLKLDGETVTGNSSSQLGDSTVKSGSWKDGKLVFQLEGQNGVISMSAVVVEGKLSGEFDYSGQLQGKWVAVKKN